MPLEGVKICVIPVVDGDDVGVIPLSTVTLKTLMPLLSALNEIVKVEEAKQNRGRFLRAQQ
jgi:hypothetical protein